MKLWLALAATALVSCSATASEPALDGRWTGSATVEGATTRIGVDFRHEDGRPAGVLNLADERLLGKVLPRVEQTGRDVVFDIPGHDATFTFTGRLEGDVLTGDIRAGPVTIPIRFDRQGPIPAPPYREIPLTFVSHGTALHGSLLLPPGQGPVPAVVMAHGSSTPDRNDYRYYADLYARAGIAAFIYDKRDTGSEEDGGTVPLEVLADDLRAAVAVVRAHPGIDPAQIGLWGFSQGGWLIPMLAADGDYAFAVTLSGPGVSYAELNLYAERTRLGRQGFSATDIEAAEHALVAADRFARGQIDAPALDAVLTEARTHPWARRTTLPATVPDTERLSRLRWKDLDLDPARYWARTTEPTLVLLGGGDEVVPADRSAERIRAALREAGASDVTLTVYPGANHNLVPVPGLERDMIAWSLARVRRPQ